MLMNARADSTDSRTATPGNAAEGGKGVIGYAIAILGAAVATAINWRFQKELKEQIGPLYFAVIALSGAYGGLGPGLTATILAGLCSIYFFFGTPFSLQMEPSDYVRVGVFFVVAIVVSSLHGRQKQLKRGLESKVAQRTKEVENASRRLAEQLGETVAMARGWEESEKRYRELVEAMPDATLIQCDGQIRFVNTAARQLFGASSSAELEGKPAMEIVHPQWRKQILDRIESLRSGRLVPAMEEQFLRLDGATVDVEVAACPVRFEGRDAALLVARDITQRKRAARELAQMVSYAKFIVWEAEVTGLEGWEQETDGTTSRFDWKIRVRDEKAAQEILPLDVPPGRTYFGAWVLSRSLEDRIQMRKSAWRAFIQGKTFYAQQFRCRDKHGELRWIYEHVALTQKNHGQWDAFGVCTDVTELRRAETELKEVASHARCILWNAVIEARGDWRNHPEGGEEFFRWDIAVQDESAAQRVLPLELDAYGDFMRAWAERRNKNDEREMWRKCALAFIQGGRSYSQDFRVTDKFGRLNWIHEDVEIDCLGEGRWRAYGVCTNVTEQREAAESMRRMAEHARCILWQADVRGLEGWSEEPKSGDHRFKWTFSLVDESAAQAVLPLEIRDGEDYRQAWRRSEDQEDHVRMDLVGAQALAHGDDHYAQEFRCRDKFGKVHWLREVVTLEKLGEAYWRAFGVATDVTKLKEAEERESKLAAIVTHSTDAIVGSENGIITSWNEAAERVFGYSAEEAIGRSVLFTCPPDQMEAAYEKLECLLGGLAVENVEIERIRKDGKCITVRMTASPIRDKQGRIIGSSAIVRDVTELREAAEDAQRIARHARCILWHADVKGLEGWEKEQEPSRFPFTWKYTFLEDSAAQTILPLDLAQFRTYGDAWDRSRNEEDRIRMNVRGARALVNREKSYSNDFRCTDRFGNVHWLREEVALEPLEHGHWQAFGVCTNITDQKKVEEALRASKEQFARFMDHLPGLAFIKDAESRVLYLNEYHKQISDCTDQDWCGKKPEELFPPEVAAIYKEHDRRVLNGDGSVQAIEPVLQRDGSHDYLVTKFLIPERPGIEGPHLGGVAIDVTELRRAATAVRVQKSTLEAMMEASLDGVLVVGQQGQWLEYNRRFLLMWEIDEKTNGTLANATTDKAADPQIRERVLSGIQGIDLPMIAAAEEKTKDPVKFRDRITYWQTHPNESGFDRVEMKDGRVIDRYTAPVADKDGGVYGRVWFFHDSTEEEQAKERLRNLASELTIAEERERRELATILHDRVSQTLALGQIKLDELRSKLDRSAAETIAGVSAMLEEALEQTRNLTSDLSPPVLQQLGLVPAVQWLAERVRMQFGVDVEFESQREVPEPDALTRAVVFQAIRELLTNMLKHAKAQKCLIVIGGDLAGKVLIIQVNDDGVGFDVAAATEAAEETTRRNCFGLFNVRERIMSLGGCMKIESAPGRGSRFELILPARSTTRAQTRQGKD